MQHLKIPPVGLLSDCSEAKDAFEYNDLEDIRLTPNRKQLARGTRAQQARSHGPASHAKAKIGHYTYLILAGLDSVKIGHSASPRGRLSELQVGCPGRLSLFQVWRLRRPKAIKLEGALHALFDWARGRGEWFSAEPAAVRSVGAMLIEGRESDAATVAAMMRTMRDLMLRRNSVKPGRTSASEREAIDREYYALRVQALRLGMAPNPGEAFLAERGALIPAYERIASEAATEGARP
jgi:hypothetical protein